jgi:hypothetical protein
LGASGGACAKLNRARSTFINISCVAASAARFMLNSFFENSDARAARSCNGRVWHLIQPDRIELDFHPQVLKA